MRSGSFHASHIYSEWHDADGLTGTKAHRNPKIKTNLFGRGLGERLKQSRESPTAAGNGAILQWFCIAAVGNFCSAAEEARRVFVSCALRFLRGCRVSSVVTISAGDVLCLIANINEFHPISKCSKRVLISTTFWKRTSEPYVVLRFCRKEHKLGTNCA